MFWNFPSRLIWRSGRLQGAASSRYFSRNARRETEDRSYRLYQRNPKRRVVAARGRNSVRRRGNRTSHKKDGEERPNCRWLYTTPPCSQVLQLACYKKKKRRYAASSNESERIRSYPNSRPRRSSTSQSYAGWSRLRKTGFYQCLQYRQKRSDSCINSVQDTRVISLECSPTLTYENEIIISADARYREICSAVSNTAMLLNQHYWRHHQGPSWDLLTTSIQKAEFHK